MSKKIFKEEIRKKIMKDTELLMSLSDVFMHTSINSTYCMVLRNTSGKLKRSAVKHLIINYLQKKESEIYENAND